MIKYDIVKNELKSTPKVWLITGVAGFIGANLLETLLKLDQTVVGLDNFATGFQHNLDDVRNLVSNDQWSHFSFIEGDITCVETCKQAVKGVDYVLHQAALGSVPRSIADPIATNAANISGFLNMLSAAKDEGVTSFTYAASSSTYGDHPGLPKVEDKIGKPLSPYAVTKYVNELYAEVFERSYGFKAIGLRYFNVFGRRQDPDGAYAAVIPKWTAAMLRKEDVYINGDGETSRDFTHIENVIQGNILAAVALNSSKGHVFNMACGDRTSLLQLFNFIKSDLNELGADVSSCEPQFRDFRAGDVRHSLADITKIQELLGYEPIVGVGDGLTQTMSWYKSEEEKRMTKA